MNKGMQLTRPVQVAGSQLIRGVRVDGRSIRVTLGGDGPGAPDEFRALFTR